MKLFARTFLCLALVAGMLVVVSPEAQAQGVTNGALSGTVTAAEDGFALPGAQITATHEPTGTRYSTVSRNDGRWTIQNVRVGGPYTIEVTMDGFRSEVINEVNVNLGEDTNVPTPLELDTVSDTLTVTADFDPLINPSKTGVNTNVSEEAIENLPTITRGLEDFARLSPYFSVTGGGAGDEESIIAVAGRNNRYNNIQIDGAVNNDLFGLAGSGTPGGQAATQPISLDAVQEIALQVTPYDVRQGGFSGGGINVITKNGTNDLQGSAYYYTRDQDLVGDGPFDAEVSDFSNDEYGFTLGGPILQDELFYFVSGEQTEREQPSGFAADGSAGQNFQNPAAAQAFRQILMDQYGYDPGGLGEFSEQRGSDKLFARLDWNVADNHQLTFRHNYIDADNDIYRTDDEDYSFPDTNYDFFNETNSTVLQLNSTWADLFNEFRVTYQTIEDRRTGGTPFPAIDVDVNGDELSLSAGTEPFSTKNALDQEIFELTNDLTWLVGDHQITVGTHNEIFSFDNLFIRQAFGDYSFTSLEALRLGRARSFDYSFSATDDPNQSAKFDVTQLGFYAGDQWRAADNLSLTYGLRVDIPQFPDEPSRNPDSERLFGFRTDVTADGNQIWSPRIGFNWDPTGEARFQVRGGVGLFSGRTPYVWLSNQYSNTGIEFTRISAFISDDDFDIDNNFIPFSPDPNNQPTMLPGIRTFTNEINLIDPEFEFPQVLRTSLGFDAELPWGFNGTVEAIYSETEEDVLFQNLAVRPTGQTFFDGRPLFSRGVEGVSSAILLTNTGEGKQESYSAQLTRPFDNGLYTQVGYIYNDSEVVTDGTSSQALSNWRFNEVQGDPNNPTVGTSDFEIQHRFNAAVSYTFDMFAGWGSTVVLFYNAQSGAPYSTTFSNDINGDFESNDLLYVPASQDEVVIVGGTWEDLDAYIRGDEGLDNARGGIVTRNASRAPWRHNLDFSYSLDIPIVSSFRTQLKLDILNVGNLIDSDNGVVRYVNFGETSPVRYGGIDDATGKPIYILNNTDLDRRFSTDDLRSRWQAQIGLRLQF